MCTKNEAKEASLEALKEYMEAKDSNGLTVVEDEMQRILNKAVSKLTFRFGVSLFVIAFVSAGAWFTLNSEVNSNTESRTQGSRYTLEDHKLFEQTISNTLEDVRRDHDRDIGVLGADILEMKGDIKFIRQQFGG